MFRIEKQCEIRRSFQKRSVVLKYLCFVPSFMCSVSPRKLLVLLFDCNLHLDWLPEGSLLQGEMGLCGSSLLQIWLKVMAFT